MAQGFSPAIAALKGPRYNGAISISMGLVAGTRSGSYEILSALGAGGMGEVYKARDTKLGRDVAIKILPDAFVADPERVARFEREARLLAALNHPNIAAIYGLEESPSTSSGQAGSTKFLVLELVDGDSLADRLVRLKADPTKRSSANSRKKSSGPIGNSASYVGSGFSRTGLAVDEALQSPVSSSTRSRRRTTRESSTAISSRPTSC